MSDYWFERIDGRLERLDAHMERANELFERNERAFERNTAAYERWEAQQDDMREFMREITLRVERSGREHTREIRRVGDHIVTELGAELHAVRDALLAILGRLEPGDSGSTA